MLVAATCLWAFRDRLGRRWRGRLWALTGVVTTIMVGGALLSADITRVLEQQLYSANIIYAEQSSYQRIVSGAAHDALYLDDIADTGMLFVPSVDGKTHNEAEFTEWSDCLAGASVFANTTERLATD